jgi:hypothetical protein
MFGGQVDLHLREGCNLQAFASEPLAVFGQRKSSANARSCEAHDSVVLFPKLPIKIGGGDGGAPADRVVEGVFPHRRWAQRPLARLSPEHPSAYAAHALPRLGKRREVIKEVAGRVARNRFDHERGHGTSSVRALRADAASCAAFRPHGKSFNRWQVPALAQGSAVTHSSSARLGRCAVLARTGSRLMAKGCEDESGHETRGDEASDHDLRQPLRRVQNRVDAQCKLAPRRRVEVRLRVPTRIVAALVIDSESTASVRAPTRAEALLQEPELLSREASHHRPSCVRGTIASSARATPCAVASSFRIAVSSCERSVVRGWPQRAICTSFATRSVRILRCEARRRRPSRTSPPQAPLDDDAVDAPVAE